MQHLPPSFLAGPDDPRYHLLAKKEVMRLLAVYKDNLPALQQLCLYRQFLYDCTLVAEETLEKWLGKEQ